MLIKRLFIMMFLLSLSILSFSCAAKKEAVKVKEEKAISGIKGIIIPVDQSGNEIEQQERGKIVINCVPLREGKPVEGKTITKNPEPDGRFMIELKEGEYNVEFFLKGFNVTSFRVEVSQEKMVDLGSVKLQKIATVHGEPILESQTDKKILNEGDVNIQPPSF